MRVRLGRRLEVGVGIGTPCATPGTFVTKRVAHSTLAQDPLDIVEAGLIILPVVEPGRPSGLVICRGLK